MNQLRRSALLVPAVMLSLAVVGCGSDDDDDDDNSASTPARQMSFFVTSRGLGNGADLGGLDGADRHCQALAQAAGAGSRTWRAYLSTQATATQAAVNARDRIGTGPWRNFQGAVIASDVAQLHGQNNLTKDTARTETGGSIEGVGDTPPVRHDILTGTQPDGTSFPAGEDRTCSNWTSSSTTVGQAMVGHSDRQGTQGVEPARSSWNASHLTRNGCSQAALVSTGGAGLLYCFATN